SDMAQRILRDTMCSFVALRPLCCTLTDVCRTTSLTPPLHPPPKGYFHRNASWDTAIRVKMALNMQQQITIAAWICYELTSCVLHTIFWSILKKSTRLDVGTLTYFHSYSCN
ncbi:hypothetical protein L9F63_013078, partial [Diploptera punctata]